MASGNPPCIASKVEIRRTRYHHGIFMVFHGNSMANGNQHGNHMVFHGVYPLQRKTTMETTWWFPVGHGIRMKYHDIPWKLHWFSMETTWRISVRESLRKMEAS